MEFTTDINEEDAGDSRERDPTMDVLPNGNIVVAWEQESTTNANIDDTVGIRVLQADGTPVSSEFFPAGGSAASEGGPSIIALSNTKFVYAFFDDAFGISARVVTLDEMTNTLSAGAPVLINSPMRESADLTASVTQLDNGNLAFAFTEFTSGFSNPIVGVRITDSDLNDLSGVVQVSETTVSTPLNANISADGNQITVVWVQNLPSPSFTPTLRGFAFTANNDGTIPPLMRGDITLDAGAASLAGRNRGTEKLANGDLVIAFNSDTTPDPDGGGPVDPGDVLRGVVYSHDLATVRQGPFDISQNPQDVGASLPSLVAFPGGGFGAAYQYSPDNTQIDVQFRVFDNTYSPVGNQMLVNDASASAGNTDDFRPVAELVSADGDVTVIWTRETGSSGGNDMLRGRLLADQDPNPVAANTPPVVSNAIADDTVNEGDADAIFDLTSVFSDAEDNDADLTYAVDSNTGSTVVGAAVNNSTDQLTLDFDNGAIGAATIVVSATDSGGLSVTDSFTITVNDSTAPTAVAQNIMVQLDLSGNASIVAGDVDGGSTDNVAIASLSVSPSNFDGTDVGPNSVTLTVTDTSGNQSMASPIVTIVDVTPPLVDGSQGFSYAENQAANFAIGTVLASDNAIAPDGVSSNVTGFNIVSGNASGFFAIDASGNLTLTAAGAAAASAANDFETGANMFTLGITATDSSDNTSATEDVTVSVTDLDETPPAKPPAPDLIAASDTGVSDQDDVTADNTPTFSVAGEANSMISLVSSIDGPVGAGMADALGMTTITASLVMDGTHQFTVTSTDQAGNVSMVSDPLQVVIDSNAPDAPTGLDLRPISDTGIASDDNVTMDDTPAVSGSAEANGMVTITSDLDGIVGMTNASGGGAFALTLDQLTEGVHNLTATVSDAAGNPSPASVPLTVAIDLTPPTLSAVDLIDASDTGNPMDDITEDGTPTIEFTAEAGSMVEVDFGDGAGFQPAGMGTGAAQQETLGTAYAADGPKTIQVRATDLAGNVTLETLGITVFRQKPPLATDDAAIVSEDGPPVAIGVLANDLDPNADAISLTSVARPGPSARSASRAGWRPTTRTASSRRWPWARPRPTASSIPSPTAGATAIPASSPSPSRV